MDGACECSAGAPQKYNERRSVGLSLESRITRVTVGRLFRVIRSLLANI